ncbi:MAG: hypothetical protein ACK56I_21720, partial [bacterium]
CIYLSQSMGPEGKILAEPIHSLHIHYLAPSPPFPSAYYTEKRKTNRDVKKVYVNKKLFS